jgi:hypothetical protein
MSDFNIYLTFDIDQDFNPQTNDYYNRTNAEFESFKIGFTSLIDKIGGIPFSVFIRADQQIDSIYGSYDHLFKSNPEVVDKIIQSNGELNWHIHLYKEINKQWTQIREEKEMVEAFIKAYNQVSKILDLNHHIVRIGECVMNNSLMKAICDCGIEIDSTALPGRSRNDLEKYFNWKTTTNHFYQPSIDDYRVPGPVYYNLTEIPMSTLFMKADYDNKPIRRYFNLSFKTEILFQRFDEYIQLHDSIVIITHPFEVLAEGKHGLISFNKDTFSANLAKLKERILANNKKPVFRKISQFNQN